MHHTDFKFAFSTRIFFLFLLINLFSNCYASDSCKKIVLLSIPKAGTHLVGKAIEKITGKKIFYDPEFHKNLFSRGDDVIYVVHITSEYDFLKIDDLPSVIKVLAIRDPRDIILSQIAWIQDKEAWWLSSEKIKEFNQLPFEKKIYEAIMMPDENYGVYWFTKNALTYMKNPSIFICRFEDLIGPLGGGMREKQEEVIQNLAEHLGFHPTFEKIQKIADELFGGTYSFRKGSIGEWEHLFSDENKSSFKERFDSCLLDLGYEKDNCW